MLPTNYFGPLYYMTQEYHWGAEWTVDIDTDKRGKRVLLGYLNHGASKSACYRIVPVWVHIIRLINRGEAYKSGLTSPK